METNKIINNLITPNDILRLYIDDSMIDDSNDIDIDPKKIFLFEKESVFSSKNGVEPKESLVKQDFLDDYLLMINNYKFYIKLPLNLYLKHNVEEVQKLKNSFNILKINNLKNNLQNDFLNKVKKFFYIKDVQFKRIVFYFSLLWEERSFRNNGSDSRSIFRTN